MFDKLSARGAHLLLQVNVRNYQWPRCKIRAGRKHTTTKSRVEFYRTIGVNFNSGAVLQQQGHYFQASRFGAVVKGRVAFDALSIYVCLQRKQEFGDFQVALVAYNHETCVTMSVGNFDV